MPLNKETKTNQSTVTESLEPKEPFLKSVGGVSYAKFSEESSNKKSQSFPSIAFKWNHLSLK